MNPEADTTPINGRRVPYREDVVDIEQLQFWDANPRVYAAVRGVPEWNKADPMHRQQIIQECMEKEESTRSVLEGLKLHQGQQEPLIVDLRGNIVIEGNSRLAALRILAREDPAHWGAAICRCYNDLTEEERFALLSEMHIIGKKEWTPYAKASTYWRQHHELEWELPQIARVNRTNVNKVKRELATIDLMTSENELNEQKYSWYNVLISTQAIKPVFESNAEFRSRVLDIVRDASPEATDPVERASYAFRDGLTTLVKRNRPLRKFCSGHKTLQEAVDEAQMSTLSAKLRKARSVLGDIDSTDFVGLSRPDLNEAARTFKRLRRSIDTIGQCFDEAQKMLDTPVSD